jgi:hypothetical protein
MAASLGVFHQNGVFPILIPNAAICKAGISGECRENDLPLQNDAAPCPHVQAESQRLIAPAM